MKIIATIMVLCWATFFACIILSKTWYAGQHIPVEIAAAGLIAFAGGFASIVASALAWIWRP